MGQGALWSTRPVPATETLNAKPQTPSAKPQTLLQFPSTPCLGLEGHPRVFGVLLLLRLVEAARFSGSGPPRGPSSSSVPSTSCSLAADASWFRLNPLLPLILNPPPTPSNSKYSCYVLYYNVLRVFDMGGWVAGF